MPTTGTAAPIARPVRWPVATADYLRKPIDPPRLIARVLDRHAIARLHTFGGPPLVARMAALFAESGAGRIRAAADAASRGDCPAVGDALHSLKSSAAQLGATALALTCQEGETRARAHDAASLEALVADAAAQFAAAVRDLEYVVGSTE
ncbi:MAG: Hpt domain-containing protein [Gemmatimonadota bacterium]|nr:Hpt domain-containing protein [Gemmatimonadota bacterium]